MKTSYSINSNSVLKGRGISPGLITLFLFVFFSFSFSKTINAQVVVLNSSQCFAAMDGNPLYDSDGPANGTLTMTSLTIQAGGSITNNDPSLGNPCDPVNNPGAGAGNITIIVTGDVVIQLGGSIDANNNVGSGAGGNISLTVGGNLSMDGGLVTSTAGGTSGSSVGGDITINVTGNVLMENGALITTESSKFDGGAFNMTVGGSFIMQGVPGATISTQNTSGNGDGGALTIHATGEINVHPGSIITASSGKGKGGTINISGDDDVDIDGQVLSESGGSGTGCNHGTGGYISISAVKTLLISDEGKVSSKSGDPGADLVHLCGCNVTIYGLVQSTGAGHAIPCVGENSHVRPPFRPDKDPNSTAGVEVWAYNSLVIDNTGTHKGEINADLSLGAAGKSWIDIFSYKDINVISGNGPFAIHANVGGNNGEGGRVTVKSVTGNVSASGNFIQANSTGSGVRRGGDITVHGKGDLNLVGAKMQAKGVNFGGKIDFRSFGTAPATGNINMNLTTNLDVSVDGTVTETACGTVGAAAIVGTAAVVVPVTGVCGGNPTLQPYVVFCECGCTTTFTLTKILSDPTKPPTMPFANWTFTLHKVGGGFPDQVITIPAGGGVVVIPNLPDGDYTITEDSRQFQCPDDPTTIKDYIVTNTCGNFSNGFEGRFTIVNCQPASCSFTNIPRSCAPGDCQWCTKSAVLSQVWQNPGGMDPSRKCVIPDILVDVRMPHGGANDVVTASEIGTGIPATWSIQVAVDYANAHRNDPAPNPFRIDEIFIGVTAADPVPLLPGDPNGCGNDCGRPPSGDNPKGVENVVVTNLSTERMNIFGCSVTMRADNVNLPVFTVQDGVGKVTILDLHVWNSNVAGYLVKAGNNGLVTIKNSSAYFNDLGYDVQDDNVQVSGAQHMRFNRIGALIEGSNNPDVLRTNNDITNNWEAGIKITGNNNETNGNEVGTKNFPNAVGVIVTGNNNNLHDGNFSFNTGKGLYVTGNNNIIKQNDCNSNGSTGIHVLGSGNMLQGNKAEKNGGNGILACGQVDQGGNSGSGNALNPQVDFACIVVGPARFVVTDISTDKAYKYDASFNLVSSSALTGANSDANDAANNGTKTYVLDKSDKQVYSYVGATTAASKVLKEFGGGSLSSPVGLAISGDAMWVADESKKKIYRYSLASAFAGAGNLNALQEIAFTAGVGNANAGGLAIDGGFLYVLDNNDKQFYRYPVGGGAGVASKVMKESAGGGLGAPAGATVDAGTVWIVDNNNDKAYSYSLASLFPGGGNLNASSQFSLNAANGNSTGIAVGSDGNFPSFRETIVVPEQTIVKDAQMQVYPNPSSSYALVQFSSSLSVKYTLKLTDITGRVIMSENGVTTQGTTVHEFDVSRLTKGTYLVVLEKAGMNREQQKIIVQ